MHPPLLIPSELLKLAQDGQLPNAVVAVDTETSGLHADDGARISTVSVSWVDWTGQWKWVRNREWAGGIQTYRKEEIHPDYGKRIGVVSMAWPFDQGVTGTGKPEDTGAMTLWQETENLGQAEWDHLLAWLQLVGRLSGLSMHNSKFDCQMFRAGVRPLERTADLMALVVWDTQTGNDLIWGGTDATTSLKGRGSATERLWGEAESDEQAVIKTYLRKNKLPTGRWDLMPWSIIAKYAEQDARLTSRLQAHQRVEIQVNGKPDWMDGIDGRMLPMEALKRRMNVTAMLYRMENKGLPFSRSEAMAARVEIRRRIEESEAKLPFQPATGPMAKHYWFGEGNWRGVEGQGMQPLATTPTGKPKFTIHEVGQLVDGGYPGAVDWQRLQKLTTADSMWYSGYSEACGPDGRLRTNIRQFGTVSGRFSSSRVNTQSMPHDYRMGEHLQGIPSPRGLILAGVPDGWKLWELDLANAELRVAALFANCAGMLKLINTGADLHGQTAIDLFGVDPKSQDWDKLRTVAKRGNFSLIFGVGPEELQRNIDEQAGVQLSDEEVQVMHRDWNRLYPEYQRAIRLHMNRVEDRQRKYGAGWIQTANGERRWFKQHEDTHKAFNQRVQPSLAQFGMDWWLAGEKYLTKQPCLNKNPGTGLVLTVHDSMIVLVPDNHKGTRFINELSQIGVDLWTKTFPGVPGGVDAKPFGS